MPFFFPLMLHKVKLTYRFTFHSGQDRWQTNGLMVGMVGMVMVGNHPVNSLRRGERNHRTNTLTKIPSHMCLQWEMTSDGVHFCSEFLAISSPASLGQEALPDLNRPVMQCTGCQRFCLAASWEEKYVINVTLLFLPPPLPQGVCSVASAVPTQAQPQASAIASWSEGHGSSNKYCKIKPLAFRVGEISDRGLNSSN